MQINHRLESALLELANGTRWRITGNGECESALVSRLKHIMRMQVSNSCVHGHTEVVCSSSHWKTIYSRHGNSTVNMPRPSLYEPVPAMWLAYMSSALAAQIERISGVLLHGALADRNGVGVILAGRSGSGKTTSSGRLPPPWKSLSDDMTLVVRMHTGQYFAHPWPTWSKFESGFGNYSWDVQRAVPLRGIFILDHANNNSIEPVGPAQTTCLLTEVAEQAQRPSLRGVDSSTTYDIRLRRFNNICALGQNVPGYILRMSLKGAFWEHIEAALGIRDRTIRMGDTGAL